ncbi:selenium cofactor biosynthesis protein YqeC [Desulfosediminicola ganghwensis]|uniref:selenium cofactor biosynthesis protein YqeC n=1 Tax=Desulfosediminicola ganghwensis TaxID=2569540 RepID=UPI00142EB59B|nr:selenium cofactor biosynthesis protein YqeC [Desulfosediminicola ganghwensis]
MSEHQSFLSSLKIRRGEVISLVGAGGKTSLMYRLAEEGRAIDWRVLVTTSTRILTPRPEQYDLLDLSGGILADKDSLPPGIYVTGVPDSDPAKMRGVAMELLYYHLNRFDLVLIEADGSAGKPLKGWQATEPVVPHFTSSTVGVLDIQTIGRTIDDSLVHRPGLFSLLTGGSEGDMVSLGHLLRVITQSEGLFKDSVGAEKLFINKVESRADQQQTDLLTTQIENVQVTAGSVQQGTIYGS